MSYGLNLGWGGLLGDYIWSWGGGDLGWGGLLGDYIGSWGGGGDLLRDILQIESRAHMALGVVSILSTSH